MNIDSHELMSPGGMCKPVIKLLPALPVFSVVSQFPKEYEGRLVGEFGVVTDQSVEVNAVRDTIEFEENQIDVGGAPMYRQTLRMIVSRPTFDRLNALHQISSSHHLIFFETMLGETRMMGRLTAGAAMRFSTASKTEVLERNEAVVEFYSTQQLPAPRVESPF